MSVLSIHFRLVFSAFLSLIIVSCEPTTDVVEEKNNAAALMSKLEAASAAYIKSRITIQNAFMEKDTVSLNL